MSEHDKLKRKHAIQDFFLVFCSLAFLLVLAIVAYGQYSDCKKSKGTLVRGVILFECVQEGRKAKQ